MGKHKAGSALGRTIIKDRFSGRRGRRDGDLESATRHTSELNDGYEWGRLNLQSVTEQSNLDDFLATAELAGTEFTAEKLNVEFVNPRVGVGLLTAQEQLKVTQVQNDNKHWLRIPRRPAWEASMTADELQQREREAFLEWRRKLAELQEVDGIILTPFEKNLEFWRQLWRVVERSDIVVQIVDARNPVLFRCEDLEKYVKETGEEKLNMILVNKADLLAKQQREAWANYFQSIGLPVVFFSALYEFGTTVDLEEEEEDTGNFSSDKTTKKEGDGDNPSIKALNESDGRLSSSDTESTSEGVQEMNLNSKTALSSGKLCSKEELIGILKTMHTGKKLQESMTTVGLVGYPNVGKSSTINAILSCKKVSVSATPGKTKHFQTLFVDPALRLCDCPGLVMPTFVSTKAEMVVNGILPIDQMRDHVGPTNFILAHIPRHVLEGTYGIVIPKPSEEENADRLPTAEEFLNSYGYMRGFMTQRGLPDHARAARYVLKDYVKGKLLFCHAPPTENQVEFHLFPTEKCRRPVTLTPYQSRIQKAHKVSTGDLDQAFFSQTKTGVHFKGPGNIPGQRGLGLTTPKHSSQDVSEKPWKKHGNKNKREKLRRVHAALDQ